MKAITIKQPWATLIAEGYKEYEFRNWKTKYRGEILIHAGKGIDKKAMERFQYLNLKYPIGQIIAKANITDCVKIDDELREELKEKDSIVYKGVINKTSSDWDGYGFKLENIERIEPIEINGKLSLWDYDYKK
ncbi:MAG: ASCH domain-containing protein [Clostridia bacterium]